MASWMNISRLLASLIFVALFTLSNSSPASAQRPTEDRAKVIAAFLYKFLTFVEWPEEAFESPSDAFRIHVLHDDDVKAAVIESVAGKEVKGRTIEVRSGSAADEAVASAHVLFIGDANEHRVRDALDQLAGKPVLTVGLDERFAKRGGIIRLYEADRRLNIEVNLTAAQRADLEISSKLLAVAKVLRNAEANAQAEREGDAELPDQPNDQKVD